MTLAWRASGWRASAACLPAVDVVASQVWRAERQNIIPQVTQHVGNRTEQTDRLTDGQECIP